IAVNTLGTYVEARCGIARSSAPKANSRVKEVFSGEPYAVSDGAITAEFRPYETKAFHWVEK
ncbi:MAG: hypothetical protein PHY31_07225, partial [Smithellaceae bacterium]|nr:hypothetical protein [Smithellaceae bacterium]